VQIIIKFLLNFYVNEISCVRRCRRRRSGPDDVDITVYMRRHDLNYFILAGAMASSAALSLALDVCAPRLGHSVGAARTSSWLLLIKLASQHSAPCDTPSHGCERCFSNCATAITDLICHQRKRADYSSAIHLGL
jgi:predicted metal-binding membrane protein